MKRKNFLKGMLGLAAAGKLLTGRKALAQEAAVETGDKDKKMEAKKKFLLGWITAWLANMKQDLPEAKKVQVIEDNGRACAERSGLLDWARSFNGDVDKFLAEMRKHIDPENAKRDGSKVSLVYEECFCPLVADIKESLPPDYCLCTRGWTKAVYAALTGKPVKVELKSSIRRGDPKCVIEVDLS